MSYGGGYPPQQQYGQHGQQYGAPPPPHVQPPWRAEWIQAENHYIFVNEQTGQRSNYPPGPSYGGPPPAQGYGGGYGAPPQQSAPQGHNWKSMAVGGAGGALLGGFLTHEYDKHKEHERDDEYRREERRQEDEIERLRRQNDEEREELRDERSEDRRRYEDNDYRGGNTYIENTYVQERRDDDYREDFAERRDDDYRGDYRREDQGIISDIADDVSGWAGREEGRVERFGDGIEDSFDRGRDDERYDGGRDEDRYDDDRY